MINIRYAAQRKEWWGYDVNWGSTSTPAHFWSAVSSFKLTQLSDVLSGEHSASASELSSEMSSCSLSESKRPGGGFVGVSGGRTKGSIGNREFRTEIKKCGMIKSVSRRVVGR